MIYILTHAITEVCKKNPRLILMMNRGFVCDVDVDITGCTQA